MVDTTTKLSPLELQMAFDRLKVWAENEPCISFSDCTTYVAINLPFDSQDDFYRKAAQIWGKWQYEAGHAKGWADGSILTAEKARNTMSGFYKDIQNEYA
jgi:hypothetical protein